MATENNIKQEKKKQTYVPKQVGPELFRTITVLKPTKSDSELACTMDVISLYYLSVWTSADGKTFRDARPVQFDVATRRFYETYQGSLIERPANKVFIGKKTVNERLLVDQFDHFFKEDLNCGREYAGSRLLKLRKCLTEMKPLIGRLKMDDPKHWSAQQDGNVEWLNFNWQWGTPQFVDVQQDIYGYLERHYGVDTSEPDWWRSA